MDIAKRNKLIDELSPQPEPQILEIARFFDGNDDPGSIGCNLLEHPGVETFRDIFASLAARPDVSAIYAEISELDPGEGSWPYANTVYVVGSIAVEELKAALEPLEPDEVRLAVEFRTEYPSLLGNESQALLAWWD